MKDTPTVEILGIPTNDEEQARLAWATVDAIEAHPEAHKQGIWRCTTGMCFAGWAATIAGLPWRSDRYNPKIYPDSFGGPYPMDDTVIYDGKETHVSYAVAQMLGLTDAHTEEMLFSGDNTVEDIRTAVMDIFGPRP